MTKKEEEKSFVKALLKSLKINFDIINSESPDFILQHNNSKIGIEVTRIFKSEKIDGMSTHALESERNSVVTIAMNKYAELEKFPEIDVAVFFGTYPKITKSQRYELAKKLKNIVVNNLPETDNTIRINNDFENLDIYPECISQIRISNFSFITKNHWQVPVAGIVQKKFIKELQEILNNKNSKIEAYKENCDECWLLVVADSNFPSSFCDPDSDTMNNKYDCRFERAFCMWDWYGDYFEIQY
jgi:CRISPR/Cas system-associated exonuclease Cas4 (RecB family)